MEKGDRHHLFPYPTSPTNRLVSAYDSAVSIAWWWRMLTKCANPACSEQFRYLHQGKLFHLNPVPQLEAASGYSLPQLYERFWLCDRCSKEMTVVWGGTEAKIVPFPLKSSAHAPVAKNVAAGHKKKQAASAGLHRR